MASIFLGLSVLSLIPFHTLHHFSDVTHRLISDNWAACECYHALHLHSMDIGHGKFAMVTNNTNESDLADFLSDSLDKAP